MIMQAFKMTRPMKYGTVFLAGLMRLGIPLGPLRLLSVTGRKSGKIYTTPVALVINGDESWLVAAFGEVGWVRNIRASGTAQLQNGRKVELVEVSEVDTASAAPILKQFLQRFGIVPFIPPYFKATRNSLLNEFEDEAQHHPVFRITKTSKQN